MKKSIINHADEAKELLINIANSYLYKDLLATDEIRRLPAECVQS